MYKLTRINDNKEITSHQANFIEFSDIGAGKEIHKDIAIGRACLMGDKSIYYDWLTTPITEIIENSGELIHFKTENSEYKLIETPE